MNRCPSALRSVFALLLMLAPATAALAQTITATPANRGPGADFVATVGELRAGGSYRIDLVRPAAAFAIRYTLLDFTASSGSETHRLRVPTQAQPGDYQLELRTSVALAQTPFRVDPPLSLSFSPTSAAPGDRVSITVTGTRAGRLTLDYAGEALQGAIPVEEGTWTGAFIVPTDRPGRLPANVSVVATNWTGRSVTARGTANFAVQTVRTAAPYALSFTTPPPATVEPGAAFTFSGRLQDPLGLAPDGKVSFFWRAADGSRMIAVDGGVLMDAAGNFTLAGGRARAPGEFMDGVPRMGAGEMVAVVRDTDLRTGAGRDFVVESGHKLSGAAKPPKPPVFLRIRLMGDGPNGPQPISNAIVRAVGDIESGFIDPADAAPPNSALDLMNMQTQMSNITRDSIINLGATFVFSYGCPISFATVLTDANGYADFAFDPDEVRRLQILQATKKLGEIRTTTFGAPIPGIDVVTNPGGGLRKQEMLGDLFLLFNVYAGQRGFGETQTQPQLGNQYDGVVWTQTIDVGVGVDTNTNQAVAVWNHGELDGDVVTVTLAPLPLAAAAAFDLRIDNLAPTRINGDWKFKGMHTFPENLGWTANDIDVRNNTRKLRFAWDAGFGPLISAKLIMSTPGGSTIRDFEFDGDSACNLADVGDYSVTLPDMTFWPATPTGAPYCRVGYIVVEGRNDIRGSTRFDLCTQAAPDKLLATQIDRGSLNINAHTAVYSGRMNIPDEELVEADPAMTEWEIPPQTSSANSETTFDLLTQPGGLVSDQFDATTEHVIGNEATEGLKLAAGTFGFDGAATSANIDRLTILDTGLIPLFRYPWGFSPIAGAVFGADMWMSATLAFYGYMDLYAPGDNMMNATIDPVLNGGVNIFFDLDVLFGLVSASVSAQPQIGLSIKEIIGLGGVSGDKPGVCFGFDMSVYMEICAIKCFEDRFELFSVREPQECTINGKALGTGPGIGTRPDLLQPALDLGPPRLFPSATASGGAGHNLVVEATEDQRIVAHHLVDATVVSTLQVSAQALAVQHMDVEYLSGETALAVWSQSTLTRTRLQQLAANPAAVRNSTDEIAGAQTLYWSYFDGQAWSAAQKVAPAQVRTGKPRIASNRCLAFGCTPLYTPAAYLVWERNASLLISSPDIEVWGARFTPASGFAAGVRISSQFTLSSDMHPDVAWLGTRPLVAWVSGGAQHYSSTGRTLRYRFVDFPLAGGITTTIQNPQLPAGAGWPALGKINDTTVALAYTVSQDGTVVGNRSALHAARGTCNGSSCTWQSTEVRDPLGRQIRGERPRVAIDADGGVTVSLRGLAYGPDANGNRARPVDAIGMLMGTGEHLRIPIENFGSPRTVTAVQLLSNDGLQHFRPDMVYDAAADGFITTTYAAAMPAQKHKVYEIARAFTAQSPAAVVQPKAIGSSGLSIGTLPAAPDLRVERLELEADWLKDGGAARTSVDVRNVGSVFKPVLNGAMVLHAAWDAPPGVGIPAADPLPVLDIEAGGMRTIVFDARVPAGHQADHRRTLFVEVRAEVPTEEASATDNHAQVTVGAMPIPQELGAFAKSGSPMVVLQWTAPADPRVTGYRVYRRAENGEFVHYGSTDVPGYADLFAGFSNAEEYRVTSHSANGVESEPSDITLVIPTQPEAIFRGGFEAEDLF